VHITLNGDLEIAQVTTRGGAERLTVKMSKVEFLYDRIRAGKISKEKAEQLLCSTSSDTSGWSVVTVCFIVGQS